MSGETRDTGELRAQSVAERLAGLPEVEDVLAGLTPEPGRLVRAVDQVSGWLEERVV